MSISSILGITDPTAKYVGSYGAPSENIMDRTAGLGPDWSPVQQWEMWLHKPEPSVVSFDHIGLSDILKGLIFALTDKSFSTSLIKLLGAGGEKNGENRQLGTTEDSGAQVGGGGSPVPLQTA